jgi:PKD repeat protein
MKKFSSLLLIALTGALSVFAQHGHWCGYDEYRDHLDSQFPGYTLQAEAAREEMLRKMADDPSFGEYRGGVRYIPIVFHVVWNTSAQNISDATILAQLDRLNADFSSSYLNTQASAFQNAGVNTQIQFCLASTDPQGNPTNGITRTQTNVTNFGVSDNMKSNATGGRNPWPHQSYYNVWIAHIGYSTTTGGTAGFAYLPAWGSQFEAVDGTVVAYQVIGANETTLTHESGHYLGLNHTWGDLESCANDDGFADTPNCSEPSFGSWQNNGCPLTKSTCGSLDQVENFMDYASCPTLFSAQQSAFMNNILSTNYSWGQPGRAGLISSSGCDGQQTGDAPIADFTGVPTTVPVGTNVNFTDLSTNSPTQWSWTFGDGGTSAQQNPSRSYAAPGQYTVTLTATNANGSDTETKQNYITVTQNGGGNGGITTCDTLVYLDGEFIAVINPIDEPSFEAALIDNDQAAVVANLANAGYTSGWMNFFEELTPGDTNWIWGATSWHANATIAADNWITFGPITIPSDGADLSWRHAFLDMDFRDGYRVMLNTSGTDVADFNGGTTLFNLPDNDASTAAETAWGIRTVNLPGATYAGQQVYIGFHHNALDMYVLFLDDIMMYGCNAAPVSVADSEGKDVLVFPNPSKGNFTVLLDNAAPNLMMSMVDAMGRKVWSRQLSTQGQSRVEIATDGMSAGVYTLIFNDGGEVRSRRLVLSK